MKITFKLEHPKRNRSAVSARVYHEKQRYKFATGISVPTALWSGNTCGLKTGVQVTAKHGMTPLTAQNVNDSLARIERMFALSWSDELKSDEFNVSRIIRRLKGENPDPRKSTQTVVEVIEDYMDFAKSNPIGRNGLLQSFNHDQTKLKFLREIVWFGYSAFWMRGAGGVHDRAFWTTP